MRNTRRKKYFINIVSVLCLLAVISGTGFAQVPKKINWQAYVEDATGLPVDGTQQMTFAIYDAPTGGSSLWSETLNVECEDGICSTILGTDTNPIDLPEARPYYLGVTIGIDPEERAELTSVMYSLFVDNFHASTFNTFAGKGAGIANTIGSANTFVGFNVGAKNTVGKGNTFIGMAAGASNTTASANTFMGFNAGVKNTTGSGNTFIGTEAGHDTITGDSNTFVGPESGYHNTSGSANTFIGQKAGHANTTGEHNTFIGQGAGLRNKTGSGNVFLGSGAGGNETDSDKLYIDNSDTNSPLIYGEFSKDFVRINGDLEYTGTLSHVSDGRVKDAHDSFTRGLDAIEQLQPVSYRYKADNPLKLPSEREYIGLIAQEVQTVIPEAVEEGEDGYLFLNNEPIIWTMLNAIKELKAENETLREELNTLKEAIGH